MFADAYGLTGADRDQLVAAVLANHDWSYDIISTAAAEGHAAFSDYWAQGAMARARETRQWYLENSDRLRRALA
jgi:hypothetical protein